MLTQNFKNENQQKGSECKITIEEIRQFPAFIDADDATLNEISDFVFQISMVLYKAHHNETA